MSAGVLRPWHARRETFENSGSPVGSRMKRDVETVSVGTRKGDEPGNGVGAGGLVEHGASWQAGNSRILARCLIGHSSRRLGKPATWRPGLRRGRRVTGVPTAEAPAAALHGANFSGSFESVI